MIQLVSKATQHKILPERQLGSSRGPKVSTERCGPSPLYSPGMM